MKWVVRPFGLGLAGGGITTMFEDEAKVELTFDDPFGSSTSQLTSKNTLHTPLAIVGMAGGSLVLQIMISSGSHLKED